MNARQNGTALEAARDALRSGQVGEARLLLEQAIDADPKDYRPWLWLAGLAASPQESLAYIERAERLHPGDPHFEKARRWAEDRLEAGAPVLAVDRSLGGILRRLDVVATLFAGVALILLVVWGNVLPVLSLIRLVLGFVMVLYLPGYWLATTLFPARFDLDWIERTGLGLGLSVAWASLLALILDRSPWGLRLWPIMLGELLAALLFMLAALLRQARLPLEMAFVPGISWRPRAWWRSLPATEHRLYLLLLAALLLAGLTMAWVYLVPSPAEFMTEFYMLGPEGVAESFPRDISLRKPLTITLGLTNKERDPLTYIVETWIEDPWQPGRRQLLGKSESLSLPPGDSLEWPVALRMPWTGQDQQVEFLLFLAGESEPYRRLRLFLNVTS